MLALWTAVTFASAVCDGVLEGVAGDPLRGGASDYLDALGGVRSDHVLDAGVEVLGVLTDDDQIHALVARLQARDGADRPKVRVQVERLAQSHVDGTKSNPDRRRDGSLDRDFVTNDRVEDGLAAAASPPSPSRPRRPRRPPNRTSRPRRRGLALLPRRARTDAVSRNERHCLGHGAEF